MKIFIYVSVLVLIGMTIWMWPQSRVKIIFCDVGQGDGALVISGSFQMLIDVGGDNQKMLRCLSSQLPFWDKIIEVVVISHWDNDHSGGLSGIYHYYKIEKLYANQLPTVVNEQKFYPTIVDKNDVIRFDDIYFEILNKNENGSDSNENSIVGLLSYKDLLSGGLVKILMMGDVPSEVEHGLVWQGILRNKVGALDVLKVSHHGSDKATSKELLDEVNPKVAVISVGKDNTFGHPSKEVIKRLEERGIKIERTDNTGDVMVTY